MDAPCRRLQHRCHAGGGFAQLRDGKVVMRQIGPHGCAVTSIASENICSPSSPRSSPQERKDAAAALAKVELALSAALEDLRQQRAAAPSDALIDLPPLKRRRHDADAEGSFKLVHRDKPLPPPRGNEEYRRKKVAAS